MKNRLLLAGLLLLPLPLAAQAAAPTGESEADGKLRVICFGAHPDDCELKAGGVGAMWAAQGHHVKFVSVTNGDIGHWKEAGGPLATRRTKEVEQASTILGTTVQVLDNHDGELMPTLENRQKLIRLIREWRADLVLSPRPYDYHPDHRNTSLLVQDAAYMVTVPFICPDVPHLTKDPVFIYYEDRFQKPYPTAADVVVSIDPVVGRKLDALATMESQFLEGGANGHERLMPRTPAHRDQRIKEVRDGQYARFRGVAEKYRKELVDAYGKERGEKAKYAEAFEVCEYGRKPSREELRTLFPFFGGKAAAKPAEAQP